MFKRKNKKPLTEQDIQRRVIFGNTLALIVALVWIGLGLDFVVLAIWFPAQTVHTWVAASNASCTVAYIFLMRSSARYVPRYNGAMKALLGLLAALASQNRQAIGQAIKNASDFLDKDLKMERPQPHGETMN